MLSPTPGTSFSLLGTLAVAAAMLAGLSSLEGGWATPSDVHPVVTPRGTVPLPPGTPPATAPAAVAPTPQGIAPAVGAAPSSPAPTAVAPGPQAEPILVPAAEASPPSPPLPGPTQGIGDAGASAQDAPPPGASALSGGPSAAGFPVLIPSATAVAIRPATSTVLVAQDGDILVSAPPAGLAPGTRLRYEAWMPAAEEQARALRQGLLLTNIAFTLTLEPPTGPPQAPAILAEGAAAKPWDIRVHYRPSQVSGIAPASLGLYRYDRAGETWQGLPSCEPTAERPGVSCRAEGPGGFLLAGTRPVAGAASQEDSRLTAAVWAGALGLAFLLGGVAWAWWRARPRVPGAGVP